MRELRDLRVANSFTVKLNTNIINDICCISPNSFILVTADCLIFLSGSTIVKTLPIQFSASTFANNEHIMFGVLREDHNLVVYSLDNFDTPIARIPLEQTQVFSILYSNPSTLITVGNDIRIWNYQNISLFKGKCMVNLGLRSVINMNFHSSVRKSLCICDSNSKLLIPTERGFVAYDFDGRFYKNFSLDPASPGDPAAVSSKGVLVTSHGTSGITAWRLGGEKVASISTEARVTSLGFLDNDLLVYLDINNRLNALNLETGESVHCHTLIGCDFFRIASDIVFVFYKGEATFMSLDFMEPVISDDPPKPNVVQKTETIETPSLERKSDKDNRDDHVETSKLPQLELPTAPKPPENQEIIKVTFARQPKARVDRCTSPFPSVETPPVQTEEPEIPKLEIPPAIPQEKKKQPPVSCPRLPRPLLVPRTVARSTRPKKQMEVFVSNVSAHHVNMSDFLAPASARLPSIIPRYRLLNERKSGVSEDAPVVKPPQPHIFQPNPRFGRFRYRKV